MMEKTRRSIILLVAAIVISAVAFSACSLKKNTAASRNYMAFITRYNIYYNGDTHYKETLDEMEKKYEDDYSQQLYMHPVEAKSNSKAPQPSGNFDRSIEKAQKAIQLRSIKKRPKKKSGKGKDPKYKEWMKRDEYNPFLHNAWMMMGRSQYHNGDFLGAASTFFYTSKHFGWLPETVTEAKLWQARSYCGLDWLFETETILTRIKPEELTNNTLKELYNFTFADFHLRSKHYEEAIPYLKEAIKHANGSQKTRLNFLLGQVYTRLGKKKEAYEAYKKAGGASSASYRTKFNARIKQSEVYSGEKIEPEVKALKRMTRYDRNAEYLDQIYYAIGNLYLSRKDTLNAIENYKLASEKSKRNGIDKAINQVTLGQLYYERHNYDLAQPCFAEAIPQLPDNYPNYETLKRRSDVLDELAVYAQNVTLQDSLLKLSYMTDQEKAKVIGKIIEELKKKEKEEAENAKREEYLAEQAAKGGGITNSAAAPQQFNLNTDDSWYFYNTATKNAGKTDFQKRWGSRKLEDDWRRRDKASFSMSELEGESSEETDSVADGNSPADGEEGKEETPEQKQARERENDPHYPDYYLKQIPSTDAERQTSNDVIQEGLYNMGVILKDKLEDFPAAASEFGRLLSRYPDNVYRLDTYYNLYLMYMRQGDTAQAETYRQLILKDFPESKQGKAMQDSNYIDNLRAMDSQQEVMYKHAYEAYLANRNSEVHNSYNQMLKKFPMSKLMPKFMFLHALAYVTEKNTEEFKNTIKQLLELYPETDITPLATSYMKQLSQGRELKSSGSNTRGMLWDLRLSNDSTATAGPAEPAKFELDPNGEQYIVLLYPTDSVSANLLLYDIARYNFTSFSVRDYELEQMNFGRLGMLIIKGFSNMKELNYYRSKMASDTKLEIPRQVRPVIITAKNFDLLIKEGRSFEEYFKFVEEKNYREAQENVLPVEVFGDPETLEESKEINEMYKQEQQEKAAEQPVEQPSEKATEKATEKQVEKPAKQGAKQEAKDAPDKAKPTEKPQEEQKPEPKKVAAPSKPKLPDYPEGSEGDDPLFDNP